MTMTTTTTTIPTKRNEHMATRKLREKDGGADFTGTG